MAQLEESAGAAKAAGWTAVAVYHAGGGVQLCAVQRRFRFSGGAGHGQYAGSGRASPAVRCHGVLSEKLCPAVRHGLCGGNAVACPAGAANFGNPDGERLAVGVSGRGAAGVHRLSGGRLLQSVFVFPVLRRAGE